MYKKMEKQKDFKMTCECGKELKAYTQGQLDNQYKKHCESKEHKATMFDKEQNK